MQEMRYSELEERASIPNERDLVKALEARSRIHAEIEKMRNEGKALTLTGEEENMLRSFRRFKLRMRKNGEVFTWQTRLSEDVQLVKETAKIIHPSEV